MGTGDVAGAEAMQLGLAHIQPRAFGSAGIGMLLAQRAGCLAEQLQAFVQRFHVRGRFGGRPPGPFHGRA